MKKRKSNDGYGCGSVVAVMVICAFLIDALPVILAIAGISFILFGMYKYSSARKNKEIEQSAEEKIPEDSTKAESSYSYTGNELTEAVYRKNKVISEQNTEISEKNRKIEELEKELQRERQQKQNEKSQREEKEVGNPQVDELDPYVWEAARIIIDKDKCSIGMLQRMFKIGFNRAARIVDDLYKIGVVGEEIGTKPREILIDKNGLMEIEEKVSRNEYVLKSQESHTEDTFSKELTADERIQMYNNQYDYMTGEDFEMYVATILRNIGYVNIRLTKGSGDQGVDILAEKDGIKYAFQCKRYDKPVGNKAVQEVFAGKFFYHCHTAIVVTNNYFTQSAKELAHENGVVLWDRDKLETLTNSKSEWVAKEIEKINKENDMIKIIDIENNVVEVHDGGEGGISNALYIYMEQVSRVAIDMHIENGGGNAYYMEMINYVGQPIFLYNVKYDMQLMQIQYIYYCAIKPYFEHTNAYRMLAKSAMERGKEFERDLFKIEVYYDIDDIILDKNSEKKINVKKIPEVSILPSKMESIECLETIGEYDTHMRYVTKDSFPMKMENIKF